MRNVLLTITIILLMAVMGCESNMLKPVADDSSKEAKVEEAKIALDDGNYDKAISSLSGYKGSADAETSGLLASAYMGKAGLDATNMLSTLESSTLGNFDIIASALSFNTIKTGSSSSVIAKATEPVKHYVTIPEDTVTTYLAYLAKAEYYLTNSLAANPGDDDLAVQLGIASALHFVLDIGYVTAKEYGFTSGTDINLPLSQDAYQQLFPNKPDAMTLASNLDSYLYGNVTELAVFNGSWTGGTYDDLVTDPQKQDGGLRTDLKNVYNALEVFIRNLGNDQSITTDFNNFMCDIVGLPEGSDPALIPSRINSFTATQLATFINSKLLTSTGK